MASKSRKSTKSKASENKKIGWGQIILWVIFGASIIGLIITIVLQCKNESFEISSYGASNNIQSSYARCGNDGCQNKSKFPAVTRGEYKLDPSFYPVLPDEKTVCNPAGDSWLANSTEEDVKNLTVLKDGVRMRCNRSCPGQVTACGLNDKGLAKGVM